MNLHAGLSLIAFAALCLVGQAKAANEHDLVRAARGIHERVLTLDSHVDFRSDDFTAERNYSQRLDNQLNLPKMREGGLDVIFMIVYVPQMWGLDEAGYAEASQAALDKFDEIRRLVEVYVPGQVGVATSAAQVREIAASGKKAVLIGIENGYPMGTDISNVAKLYEKGGRYMSLSHNGHNQFADSSTGELDGVWLHGGLSALGRQAIAEMNRLGMMVDVSHLSKTSTMQILQLSTAPVIASHSGVRAICNHPRNLDDEELIGVARSGGVVQLVAFDAYVKCPKDAPASSPVADAPKAGNPKATVSDFVDHIDYAVKLIGIDHVGISSDFDGGGGVEGWSDASETFNVTLELVRRGYDEAQIGRIWGGNFMRVMAEVERKRTAGL